MRDTPKIIHVSEPTFMCSAPKLDGGSITGMTLGGYQYSFKTNMVIPKEMYSKIQRAIEDVVNGKIQYEELSHTPIIFP